MKRRIPARWALSALISGGARSVGLAATILGCFLLLALSVACSATGSATVASKIPAVQPTDTAVPAPAKVLAPSSTVTTIPTDSPAPTASPEPASATPQATAPTTFTPSPTPIPSATKADVGSSCPRPPDDYGRVEINGETLNSRTQRLLKRATTLYDGPGDLLRVTQGSYADDQETSFGTHASGGAVDISLRNPVNPAEVLWDEANAMVLALRRAGFAAWYRAPGDLGPGSPAHIHAIAIGDRELSPAAVEQLTGPSGYFRGLDGLPAEYGGPHMDQHGGPVICSWMIELGYSDMRE